MKLKWIVPGVVVFLLGCSEEAKENMKEAADHAKAAAENVGEAVSDSTRDINEKWTEMNKNRIEMEEKDTGVPKPVKGDWNKMKQSLSDAKDTVVEKYQSVTGDSEPEKSN
ncbi:hypothetical protein [Solemya velesiana gill symbiont]|uniref:Lipoprotein n=1 Tax=Solemya velesiana gill symbiont TaxID=1918948 RepID=A0A1T2KU08_9GAMM|nr:hypothetical protein [Solemya velesiana gill symbiont]OOZ36348.1 hypothetical protein BOW51_07595 [Solemya velesiana gill symbiont]